MNDCFSRGKENFRNINFLNVIFSGGTFLTRTSQRSVAEEINRR